MPRDFFLTLAGFLPHFQKLADLIVQFLQRHLIVVENQGAGAAACFVGSFGNLGQWDNLQLQGFCQGRKLLGRLAALDTDGQADAGLGVYSFDETAGTIAVEGGDGGYLQALCSADYAFSPSQHQVFGE